MKQWCPIEFMLPDSENCRRLSKLSRKESARVVRLQKENSGLVTSFGIYPGVVIEMIQTRPSFVIRCDDTEVAMDRELADGIWVEPLD